MSPDDRLWLVNRDQAERRQLATADRMAAGPRAGRHGPTEALRVGRTLARRPLAAVSHALRVLAHPHVPTHGAAR